MLSCVLHGDLLLWLIEKIEKEIAGGSENANKKIQWSKSGGKEEKKRR